MKAFEVLGLPDTASVADVKAAYRLLSHTRHPDKGGDPGEFHRLHIAYRAALEEAERPMICTACQGLGSKTLTRGFSVLRITCQVCGGAGSVPK